MFQICAKAFRFCFKFGHSRDTLSYVTASNSRHNPVELFANLILRSDLGARFDSKMQHSAVLGPNTALLWADSRPEICSLGSPTECSPGRFGKEERQRNQLDQDCTLLDFRLTDFGPRIRPEQCCVRIQNCTMLLFESNRALRLLLRIRFANAQQGCGGSWRLSIYGKKRLLKQGAK